MLSKRKKILLPLIVWIKWVWISTIHRTYFYLMSKWRLRRKKTVQSTKVHFAWNLFYFSLIILVVRRVVKNSSSLNWKFFLPTIIHYLLFVLFDTHVKSRRSLKYSSKKKMLHNIKLERESNKRSWWFARERVSGNKMHKQLFYKCRLGNELNALL